MVHVFSFFPLVFFFVLFFFFQMLVYKHVLVQGRNRQGNHQI